ncbi:hypothetical protein ACIPYQ_09905 [Streptomyces sp. NPDC090045]|uniref:hypothetical protein n=1 Tax=Streptomyces sp. NPDC090045 TaxID=3365927 RepID=UPI00381F2020
MHDLTGHIAPTCAAYGRIYQDNRGLIAEKFGAAYADAKDTTTSPACCATPPPAGPDPVNPAARSPPPPRNP